MSTTSFPLLQTLTDPADLRKLSRADLKALATELRGFVIESDAQTGGHLSSNLGTVELDLTAEDLDQINEKVSKIQVLGERLPEAALKMTGR